MNASVRINNFIYITLLKISILTSLDMSEVDTVWTWGRHKKIWSDRKKWKKIWSDTEKMEKNLVGHGKNGPTFWVPTQYNLIPTKNNIIPTQYNLKPETQIL